MADRDILPDRMEHFLHTRLSDETSTREERFRPSLTISRECGAGADKVGSILVDYLSEVDDSTNLGWALFNQGAISKIIEDQDLHKSVTHFLAEGTKFSVIDDLEQLLNLHPSKWTLFNYSADIIRNLCRIGNAIIVGRAGNFVTVDMANTFHVRLVGSLKRRIQYTASRHDVSFDRATDLVEETDRSRKKFVSRHIRAELDSPSYYHLVLNTDDFSPQTAARIIGDSLLEWAHQKEVELTSQLNEIVA